MRARTLPDCRQRGSLPFGSRPAMPSFHTVRRVLYPATAMLDLVADVARYPEFVPLCEALKAVSYTHLTLPTIYSV